MAHLCVFKRLASNSALASLKLCFREQAAKPCSDWTGRVVPTVFSTSKSVPSLCSSDNERILSPGRTCAFHTSEPSQMIVDGPVQQKSMAEPARLKQKASVKGNKPKLKKSKTDVSDVDTTGESAASNDNSTTTISKLEEEEIKLESEEDVSRLTRRVMTEASRVDVMVQTIPESRTEQLVLDLHHSGFKPSQILSLLTANPAYIINHRRTTATLDLLLSHGLHLDQVARILHTFPPIVHVRGAQIGETMEGLRGAGFSVKSSARVMAGNPAVLLSSTAELSRRVGALRELFKTNDVLILAASCPLILTDPWSELQAKFDYVFHEMGITQKQMVHADLFTHSLAHVKTRHAFMVRAGFFDMSKRREGERSPNAKLDQIIDTPDDIFCRKFGGFKVAEYRAFSELYQKERELMEDSESDSESEDDVKRH